MAGSSDRLAFRAEEPVQEPQYLRNETEPVEGGPWQKSSRADMMVMLVVLAFDCRRIPKGDIAGYCVVRPTWPIDAVRFRRPTGRFFNLTNSRVLPEARIWHRVTLPV